MKTFTLPASSDGLELSVMLSTPEGEAAGIVQLVHGMCEHKERYLPFMEFLCDNGNGDRFYQCRAAEYYSSYRNYFRCQHRYKPEIHTDLYRASDCVHERSIIRCIKKE